MLSARSKRQQAEPSRLATSERSHRANSYERNLDKVADQHEYENLVKTRVKPPRHHDPLPAIPEKQSRRNPRSKRNDIYESVALQDDFETTTTKHERSRHKTMLVMLFLALLLVIAELGFVVIVWRGFVAVPLRCSGACSRQDEQSQAFTSSQSTSTNKQQEIRSIINNVQGNTTSLKVAVKDLNQLTMKLEKAFNNRSERITKLEQQSNSSMRMLKTRALKQLKRVGLQGSRGLNGETGPTGLQGPRGDSGNGTNIALCTYRIKPSISFTAATSGSGQDVFVRESKGTKILGAVCSTSGTTEYNLESFVFRGIRTHKCKCRGRSTLFPTGGAKPGKSVCSIHYLSCPIVN